jgi:hypothetical protein
METVIQGLGERKYQLKERCYFSNHWEGNISKFDNHFWWDIRNHWMFWIEDKTFEAKFKKVIAPEPAPAT